MSHTLKTLQAVHIYFLQKVKKPPDGFLLISSLPKQSP